MGSAATLDAPGALAYRERVREWLRANLPDEPLEDPAFLSGDAQVEASRRWSRKLYDGGLLGLTWPVDYGGQGLGLVEQIIVAEELIAADAPGHLGVIGTDIAGPTILRYGSEAQRERFLPPILTGEEVWCQGFSEPDAGSDLASLRTRGRIEGDEIVIDGQKVWSSYAHLADRCLALVRTDPDARRTRGSRPCSSTCGAPASRSGGSGRSPAAASSRRSSSTACACRWTARWARPARAGR